MTMKKEAIISDCKQYRYTLSRCWDDNKAFILFIGLNPSTADDKEDDPTIRRLISFAKAWGYGGFFVVNLFAYRATKPTDMFSAVDPVGDQNDHFIHDCATQSDTIVFCWGVNGYFNNRDQQVISMFKNPFCFGQTINGYPKHPLYLKADTTLQPFIKTTNHDG